MTISQFLKAGLSVIPCEETKKPIGKWEKWQREIMSEETAKPLFKNAKKIGLVCGKVSGNVELLDIDLKYDETGTLYDRLCAQIPESLMAKFVIQTTVSGGYHFWYKKQSTVEGNQTLAKRKDGKVLIETRGEGGQGIVAPSKGYVVIQGSFDNLQEITDAEHKLLFDIARSFDIRTTAPKQAQAVQTMQTEEITPWDAFNNSHTPQEILEGYGWITGKQNGVHTEMTRPGKTAGEKSAIVTNRVAYIHSTSTIFETEKNLTPFALFAQAEHGGDIKAAAAELSKRGYGTKKEKTTKKEKPKGVQAPSTFVAADNMGFIGGHFLPAGWDSEERCLNYYFYVNSCKSIIKLSPAKMTRQNLLMLAPLDFWTERFPTATSFDILTATDFLVTACNMVGYFSPDKIRGRGAWMDKGRTVFHAGTELIIDGKRHALGKMDMGYIYEMRPAVKIPIENYLPASESAKLTRILQRLNFGTLADSRLLAGHLMLAPICGVLNWRPHLWITGSRKSGKSWLLDGIINVVLRGTSVNFQGNSTEMGVVQKLNNDAFSVAFDEAEGNDEKSANRMQQIIAVARAASTANGAPLTKGTKDGNAIERYIRSTFLFCSINPQITLDSDKRRFCILEFAKLKDVKIFEQIESERSDLLAGDYAERFQARAVVMMPQILKSIEVFITAVTILTGDRAVADQIGTLLGGWWHTLNDEVVSLETAKQEADAILQTLSFSAANSDSTDEERCLQAILSPEIRIDSESFMGTKTVGELVEIASDKPTGAGMTRADANERLMRLGLRVLQIDGIECLALLNTSEFIKNLLKKNAPEWSASFHNVLSRLKGAKKMNNTRFAPGTSGRAVGVPISIVFAES
jgi:hypothetical protein